MSYGYLFRISPPTPLLRGEGLLFYFLVALVLCGCGAAQNTAPTASGIGALRMEHQILFQNGDDSQVFDGFMLQDGEAFLVKAFAGPGVSLFTVARDGERHKEVLHIGGLADRLDVEKIGEDIFRIYMAGCEYRADAAGTAACTSHGESLEDTFDTAGMLTTRHFPDAHGIGLTVRYLKYEPRAGRLLPVRIELQWGRAKDRKMVIRTVSAEPSAEPVLQTIDDFLQ